jgi:hypothetical protein
VVVLEKERQQRGESFAGERKKDTNDEKKTEFDVGLS